MSGSPVQVLTAAAIELKAARCVAADVEHDVAVLMNTLARVTVWWSRVSDGRPHEISAAQIATEAAAAMRAARLTYVGEIDDDLKTQARRIVAFNERAGAQILKLRGEAASRVAWAAQAFEAAKAPTPEIVGLISMFVEQSFRAGIDPNLLDPGDLFQRVIDWLADPPGDPPIEPQTSPEAQASGAN